MGCGQKAVAEDEDDLTHALQAVGLKGDKKYGRVGVYSPEARVILVCAQQKKDKEQTIKALIYAKHEHAASIEFATEMKERQELERLTSKYQA